MVGMLREAVSEYSFLALIGLLAQPDEKHATRRRIWRYFGVFFLGISLVLGQEVRQREQSKEEQSELDFQMA
jgi:hypothetical protein